MGGNQSQEQQIPSQYRHLSQNQQNQQVLSQLYSQNQLNVDSYYNNQGYNAPHGGPGRFSNTEIKVQKTTPIKTELIINRTSLKLVKVDSKTYHLSFDYTFEVEGEISIFFAAIDQIDETTKITTKIDNKNGENLGQNKFKVAQGQNQHWNGQAYPLDLSKIDKNQLFQYDGNFQYPLMIVCDKIDKSHERKRIFYYFRIVKKADQLEIIFLKQRIEVNNMGFWTEEVYGIADSELNSRADKDCSICLSQKIDTIILPCRHMCLCYDCCNDLKQKASKCPICRQPMENFLKLVQQKEPSNQQNYQQQNQQQ